MKRHAMTLLACALKRHFVPRQKFDELLDRNVYLARELVKAQIRLRTLCPNDPLLR